MSGPWLLSGPPATSLGEPLPVGTVLLRQACDLACCYVALIEGQESKYYMGHDLPLTPCCAGCLRDNAEYNAADMETMAGTPCCGKCIIDADVSEAFDAKQRRIDEHEGAADAEGRRRREEGL